MFSFDAVFAQRDVERLQIAAHFRAEIGVLIGGSVDRGADSRWRISGAEERSRDAASFLEMRTTEGADEVDFRLPETDDDARKFFAVRVVVAFARAHCG